MGKKVVTLGEIMLRLSTPGNTRFVQSDSFDVVYGGGEANVAVSCANYGHDAYFVTKLPKHEIGQSAVNALRKYGVKTDFIARGGDRVGIYYLETGASMRPSKVIYDRAHSAIAEADAADFDFDAIMEGADWFHWSGITPAISDKAAELTRLACEAAKRHGVTVSVDLNFRKKLWTKEKAQSIMKPLMWMSASATKRMLNSVWASSPMQTWKAARRTLKATRESSRRWRRNSASNT